MAPHSLALKKSLTLYLSIVLGVIAVSCAWLAHDYRARAKKAESALAKKKGGKSSAKSSKLSQQERTYLKALFARYGVTPQDSNPASDAIAITAQMNQELNRSVPAEYSAAKTPWLPPSPRTLPDRTIPGAQKIPFSLVDRKIEFPQAPSLYQYAITNPTDAPIAMPLIHAGIRWDNAEAMIESAGLRKIEDELDRAIAIWKFVATHRYHAKPVTEGAEEHDLVKFFACYGYGFCDDASQAVAGLAKLCGLKVRIWGLEGHVVPEIFAGGKWRLLDADFAAYFHSLGDPRAVLGVEELAASREAFKNVVQLGNQGAYEREYADFFLTTKDNKPWPIETRTENQIAATLNPGQRVVFSNFNWGKYFLGAYPQRVPRYFNGYFQRPLSADAFQLTDGLEIVRSGASFTIANRSLAERRAAAVIEWPFPIVGGLVESPLPVALEFEDALAERKIQLAQGSAVSLDGAVTQVAKQPTRKFKLSIIIPAGASVEFAKPMQLTCDFQFAEMPLLRLKEGVNEFMLHTAEPVTVSKLVGEVFWK